VVASYEDALRSGVVQTQAEWESLKRAIGGPPIMRVGGMRVTNATLTTQAAALQFLQNSVQSAGLWAPLADYSQVKLTVRTGGTGGAATAVVRLRYLSTFSGTAANYLALSTDDVAVSITAAGAAIESPWTDLVAGAKTDVYLAFLQEGGDAALSPVVGEIAAYFR